MRRIMSILFAVLLISSSAFAQDANKAPDNTPRPVVNVMISTSIDGPKYEMVSHPDRQGISFRLDKETGEVLGFLNDKKMAIEFEESENTVIVPGENNFQLFLSGPTNVYLMNIPSGEVWYLKQGTIMSYKGSRFVLPKGMMCIYRGLATR